MVVYIYGSEQPGKESGQMGAYWKRFTPHGFLDCSIDYVCIAPRLAEINCMLSTPVELVSSPRQCRLSPHPVSISSAFEAAEPRELYRGKLTIKAIMSAVISISQTIMSGKER